MAETKHFEEIHPQVGNESFIPDGSVAALMRVLDQKMCRVLPPLPVLLLIGVVGSIVLAVLALYMLFEFDSSVPGAGMLGMWLVWTFTFAALLLWYAGCPGHNRVWVVITAIMSILAVCVVLFAGWILLDLFIRRLL